jgi:hypothetical protein
LHHNVQRPCDGMPQFLLVSVPWPGTCDSGRLPPCRAARHSIALIALEATVGILILLIILILVFGGGGFYVGRPGYGGAGAGMGNILYVLAVIALIVIVLRLLNVLAF